MGTFLKNDCFPLSLIIWNIFPAGRKININFSSGKDSLSSNSEKYQNGLGSFVEFND